MTALALLRARRVLATAGVSSSSPIERASSVTNEVWMTPDAVVRIDVQRSGRLPREATLATSLPPGLEYPPVILQGEDRTSEWLVLERVAGSPLSRCWPRMSAETRREAVHQFGARLRLLHATPAPPLEPLHAPPQMLDAAPTGAQAVGRLVSSLLQAGERRGIDCSLMNDVVGLVLDTATCLDPFDGPMLIHGDLTFENLLWDAVAGRITLIDYEWSRSAPRDLDLDVLLRCVAYPKLHVAEDYDHLTRAEDYVEVPRWLAEVYPELFALPRALERARLYSIASDTRELLRFPPSGPIDALHPNHPHNRLIRTVSGTSYLEEMSGRSVLVSATG